MPFLILYHIVEPGVKKNLLKPILIFPQNSEMLCITYRCQQISHLQLFNPSAVHTQQGVTLLLTPLWAEVTQIQPLVKVTVHNYHEPGSKIKHSAQLPRPLKRQMTALAIDCSEVRPKPCCSALKEGSSFVMWKYDLVNMRNIRYFNSESPAKAFTVKGPGEARCSSL